MIKNILISFFLSVLVSDVCGYREKNVISLRFVSLHRVDKISGNSLSDVFYTFNFMFYSTEKIDRLYDDVISTEMRCLLFNEKNIQNNSDERWSKIKTGDVFSTGDIEFIKQDSNLYLYSSELYFVDDGFNPITEHNQYLDKLKYIDRNDGEIICKVNVSGGSALKRGEKESHFYTESIRLPAIVFISAFE